MTVKIGEVATFRDPKPDKNQALKVLEEAAEVFGAWQVYDNSGPDADGVYGEQLPEDLLDECADVIQATCNLVAALGVEDFTVYMEACERRNKKRGRL